jgi:hypothetical protein
MFVDIWSWHIFLQITAYGNPPVIPRGIWPLLRRWCFGIYQEDKGYRWKQRRNLIKKGGGEERKGENIYSNEKKKELESITSKN